MVVQRAVTPPLVREHGEFDSHSAHFFGSVARLAEQAPLTREDEGSTPSGPTMRVSPSGKASGFHPDTRGFDSRHPLLVVIGSSGFLACPGLRPPVKRQELGSTPRGPLSTRCSEGYRARVGSERSQVQFLPP